MTQAAHEAPFEGQENVRLGTVPYIHESSRVIDSELGAWVSIGPNCSIHQSTIGDYTYAAGDAQIIYSEVGRFCSIASHVRLHPVNHPTWRVTQHHMTYRRVDYGFGDTNDEAFFDWRKQHKVVLGHDVWIGHGAVIMPGVTVGTGAVVGSGAIVTKDVEPYTIVVGVPAKPLRDRFPRAVAEKLLDIAWWDWPREDLEDRFEDFMDINTFIEKYHK